jgi:ABC-2 type transport system permease protein
MKSVITDVRHNPLFRAAVIVPSLIVLVFSLFNLTSAPDQERVANAVKVGIVNLDAGMTFPPINVAKRLTAGLEGQLPFLLRPFEDEASARAALETQEITAFVMFPEAFTKQVMGEDTVDFTVVGAGNTTMAEARIAQQMPMLLQMGIAAAVSSVRLAIAKGQLPTGALPVNMTAEFIHSPANPAATMAPFAASYTLWLSSMVGAILLFVVSRPIGSVPDRVTLRSVLPVAVTGIATLILTVTIGATAGITGGWLTFWLTVWPLALALTWLVSGLLALFGLVSILVVLPIAFYQVVLGGTQMPATAAPTWLAWMVDFAPFDHIGALLRSLILGGPATPDWVLIGGSAAVGLALIWIGTAIWARRG